MSIELKRIKHRLTGFDFCNLFIEELGWDRYTGHLDVTVDGQFFVLDGIANKRGMVVFSCVSPESGRLPDDPVRRKIERQVAKSAFEHLIIYIDDLKTVQAWQWVKREKNKPIACRTHMFHKGQTGDALAQRLQMLAFSLDEEEGLTLPEVTGRARAALDLDAVTKRFYDRFKTEHDAFKESIKGIGQPTDQSWYASVMLDRLMFVYFIQKKRFLDGDPEYLRNRLRMIQERKGKDKFLTFYRHFLIRLFHEGLGQKERTSELDLLLGKIPYLNGGLFQQHVIEEAYPEIQIQDKAFERVFDFFDQYSWHLDERPLREGNEINPDVLGYIFEKYINQKQMGAYYTKEDITDYIGKNCIIPRIFDIAREKCKVAFEGEYSVWRALQFEPDRYIYDAVKKGVELPLPPEIEVGISDISRRTEWNKTASSDFGLPAETWREVVGRRQHCSEVRRKIENGEIVDINDLITYNLNIRQFAQDIVENSEGSDLLRAFWQAINQITILDPTCGSGAFLFAALNILESIYEACLDRMQVFLEETDGDNVRRGGRYTDFRKIHDEIKIHPSRPYFIFKTIIVNNLFGVDIMQEAVEICRLRLFLKLMSQVEKDGAKPNFGIEPMPDIDFNIRAGNTLVGFVNREDVERSVSSKLDFKKAMIQIQKQACDAGGLFEKFRKIQGNPDSDPRALIKAKDNLRDSFGKLSDDLNEHLAGEYGVDPSKTVQFEKWKVTHQPFHWYAEFYGILGDGGFDVIIGNPPYVELSALNDYRVRGYSCEGCGNLYALIIERCASLGRKEGRQGYIIPVSSVSTDRYVTLQQLFSRRDHHFSAYDDRPSRLFDGLEHIRLTIHLLGRPSRTSQRFSTRYQKWMADERPVLFSKLRFANASPALVESTLPKLCSELEQSIIQKMTGQRRKLRAFYSRMGRHSVYYSRKVGYFLQVLDFEPRVLDGRGRHRPPSEFKELKFESEDHAKLALCCLNANLFYWFVTVFSDCRHVNKREVDAFPINLESLSASAFKNQLTKIAHALMEHLQKNSVNRTMRFQHDTLTVQCIFPKFSKPILDEIDRVLAQHYGFSDEELDFLLNYDIKYRMGQDPTNTADTEKV